MCGLTEIYHIKSQSNTSSSEACSEVFETCTKEDFIMFFFFAGTKKKKFIKGRRKSNLLFTLAPESK